MYMDPTTDSHTHPEQEKKFAEAANALDVQRLPTVLDLFVL